MRLGSLLAVAAVIAFSAPDAASAFPWGRFLKSRPRPQVVLREGSRDLLYEFAPTLVRRLPTVAVSAPRISMAFEQSVRETVLAGGKKNALAELTLSTGKLNVKKSFWLGPLEVKVGEFDLRKWAAVAGATYLVCSHGNDWSRMTEQDFRVCMDRAFAKGAEAFGSKDPARDF